MMTDIPVEIEVPVWFKTGGGGMIRRDCVDPDHPQSTYNYIKETYNVAPEVYGYYNEKLSKEKLDFLGEIDTQVLIEYLDRRIMMEETYG